MHFDAKKTLWKNKIKNFLQTAFQRVRLRKLRTALATEDPGGYQALGF